MAQRALLLLASLVVCFSITVSSAQANTSHAFGYDLARQLDRNQDDGQLNLSYQVSVGRRSALVLGLADGDEYQVYEAGFKRYNERYLSGTFYQLGASYWRGDEADSNIGADLRLGYEMPLTRWMVLSASISGVYGIDHPTTGKKNELVIRPHLGVLLHF
ncbi:hypothetical protein V6U78_11310 [Marinospirillum sp. MEB164]|uniref:Outer membrane protein beta-barrel domain-containing protein n=1 Tax=Marinospirillum alkalitolerans TaxID=3123374 RepID=A0ABW8PZA5_9GAMM